MASALVPVVAPLRHSKENIVMATVRKILDLNIPAARAIAAVADFYNVHTRLAIGFVTDCRADGDGIRVVVFSNGSTARETLVSMDQEIGRLSYFIASDRLMHHNASAEVTPTGPTSCRFVWTTDVLPHELAVYIEQQMELGAAAIRRSLEHP